MFDQDQPSYLCTFSCVMDWDPTKENQLVKLGIFLNNFVLPF
jgi:hypothetical protein